MTHSAELFEALCTPGTGVIAALMLAGLIGSVGHCATMCGPFVLAQLPERPEGRGGWYLMRGALFPYHLGRATTYTLLGAMLGEFGRGLGAATALQPVLTGFLLLAALLFLFQALAGIGVMSAGIGGALGRRVGMTLARLGAAMAGRRRLGGYALGVALGFLPCGLLYGALAAAAGTGSPWLGAAAMAAFSIATMPSLIAVGCTGAGLAHRWREAARMLAVPLQGFNAALLVFLAFGGSGGIAG